MNRYLAFAGSEYYPSGGWADFKGSFNSIEEAIEALLNKKESFDWWHITDSRTLKIVKWMEL